MEQQTTTTTAPVQASVKLSPILELIKKSIITYKEGFVNFVSMAFVPFLGTLPLVGVVGLFILSSSLLDGIAQTIVNIGLGLLGIAAVVILIYVSLSAQAGMIFLIKNFIAKQKAKEAFMEGRKYALQVLIVGLLTALFVILWGLLFIIPGIIFAVYYSFSIYVLLIENQRGRAALKRSKELVKGYWWAVFWRYAAVWLALFLFSWILSIPLYFLGDKSLAAQIWSFLVSAAQWVISPISIIYSFSIYKELIGIKGDNKL